MKYLLCSSDNQAQFSAEIHIHFPFRRNPDKSGVFVFPKLLVCLDCGFSTLTIPETELRELVDRKPRDV
jgi:hypothetical protein